jgi:predicted outer membrane repeat protein
MPFTRVTLPCLTVAALLILLVAGCSDDDPVAPVGNRTLAVPTQFATIQAAVDAARPGDLVVVAAGTYTDSVTVQTYFGATATAVLAMKSGVEIRSASGLPADVVLVGRDGEPVVYCVGVDSTASLRGVTITGGQVGIIGAHANPYFFDCTLTGNHNRSNSGSGGGMYWDFSSPTFINCNVTDNSATHGGGATFANDSHPTMTNCSFTDNLAWSSPSSPGTGGAMVISNDCTAVLSYCTFTANEADSTGGAIEIYNSIVDMTFCQVAANVCRGDGGGVFLNYGARLNLANCVVEDNEARWQGGGIYGKSDVVLDAGTTTILGNTAPTGPDGFYRGPDNSAEIILWCCEVELDRWVGGSITVDNENCP